jgi:hypothetical protein
MKAFGNGERRHPVRTSIQNNNRPTFPVSDPLSHRAARNVPPLDHGWKRYRLSNNQLKQNRFVRRCPRYSRASWEARSLAASSSAFTRTSSSTTKNAVKASAMSSSGSSMAGSIDGPPSRMMLAG